MKRLLVLALLLSVWISSECYEIENVFLQVPEDEGSSKMLVREAELLIRNDAPGTIILFHGFKGDKDSIRVLRTLFPRYNTMIFDFRAHGNRADDQCCSFGGREVLDVQAAVNFVRHHSKIKDKPVFAYGISMGAVSVIEAQARYGNLFDAMIVDSPFDSVEGVINRGLEKISYKVAGYDVAAPLRAFFRKYSFDDRVDKALRFVLKKFAGMNASTTATCLRPVSPQESIKKVHVPTLLIGCAHDQQVPLEAVKQIHSQSPGSTQLWVANGRGHLDAFFYDPEKYIERVDEFFNTVLQSSSNTMPARVALNESLDKS